MEGVITRATQTFTRRADYGLIGQTKQKDDELVADFRPRFEKVFRENSGLPVTDDDEGPYRQQLKNALVGAVHPGIKDWVLKNYVGLSTGTLAECMSWLIHAEKVIKNKKKGKPIATEAFWQGDYEEDSNVFFSGGGQRGRTRGRGRGVYGGRGKFRGRGREQQQRQTDRCWVCGDTDHWARNCPKNNEKQ